jgi:hypothetical protein
MPKKKPDDSVSSTAWWWCIRKPNIEIEMKIRFGSMPLSVFDMPYLTKSTARHPGHILLLPLDTQLKFKKNSFEPKSESE